MDNEYTDGPQDPGRREFLGKAVAGIGAAGALAAGLGFAGNTYADGIPTTIRVQAEVFPGLAEAWGRYHGGGISHYYKEKPTNEAVAQCIMRIGYCTLPTPRIDMKATIILPDYHFLRVKMGHIIGSRYLNEEIKPQNPALYSFIEGLRNYWKGIYKPRGRGKYEFGQAERHFSDGIFYAIGLTREDTRETGLTYNDSLGPQGNAEPLAKQFREMTPHSRRLPIMQAMVAKSNAMSESANRRNLSPDEPYYQFLTANWCALLYVWTMQWDPNRKEEYISINRNLEVPLRQGIGYKIRDGNLG